MSDPAVACTLSLEIGRKGDVALARCHGKLIAEVSGNLYNRIRQLMPEHKRIILDLTDLIHMDSMGLGTLVRLVVSAKSNGCSLELVSLGRRVRQLLGIMNLLGFSRSSGNRGLRWGSSQFSVLRWVENDGVLMAWERETND